LLLIWVFSSFCLKHLMYK